MGRPYNMIGGIRPDPFGELYWAPEGTPYDMRPEVLWKQILKAREGVWFSSSDHNPHPQYADDHEAGLRIGGLLSTSRDTSAERFYFFISSKGLVVGEAVLRLMPYQTNSQDIYPDGESLCMRCALTHRLEFWLGSPTEDDYQLPETVLLSADDFIRHNLGPLIPELGVDRRAYTLLALSTQPEVLGQFSRTKTRVLTEDSTGTLAVLATNARESSYDSQSGDLS